MTNDRLGNPAQVIEDAVTYALRLAETWPAWDGQPLPVEDRIYTTHKAVRRLSDHLLDHLAELEARLAGQPLAGRPLPSPPRPTLPRSGARTWTRRAVG